MKNFKFIMLNLACIFFVSTAISQSQNWWRVNGNNNTDQNNFIGTTNNQGLNFRTNNQNRIEILPNGDVRINAFNLNNFGLVSFDANGNLEPLLFNGTGNGVLTDNGTFQTMSSLSGWTLSGNSLFTQNFYVGIGTATPVAPLTVNGDALVLGEITATGLNVLQRIQADTIKGAIRVDVNGNIMLGEEGGYDGITSRYEELRINSRPGFDHNVVMNANTNGNLGVGVVNPQEKFDLFGNARLTGDVIFSSYASSIDTSERFVMVNKDGQTQPKNFIDMVDEMYNPNLAQCFQGYKPIWYNDEGKIYTAHLTGQGCEAFVGIGTDTPNSKLEIVGDTRTTRLHIGQYISDNSTVSLNAYRMGSPTNPGSIVKFGRYWQGDDFTYLDLRMDGTLRMQNENREIFIVNMDDETVYARRIVVDQDTWPDYVFKKTYKLRTLEEVQEHIDEYGYLPNVPSESEVLENGIDLAEMNKILLEKIEELTLYTIEQQKELNDLKEKLDQLLE